MYTDKEREKATEQRREEEAYYEEIEKSTVTSPEVKSTEDVKSNTLSASENVKSSTSVKKQKFDQMRKVKIIPLTFPSTPKVSTSSLDTANYLTSLVQKRRETNIVPIYFPPPPSVILSELNMEDYLSASVKRDSVMRTQIISLQFPIPPQVVVSSIDSEIYLKVRVQQSLMPTSPEKERVEQPSLYESPQVVRTSLTQPKKKIDINILNDIKEFLGAFSSGLSTKHGVIVIVYDENKRGIEDSLERIAEEIAIISGLLVKPDPITINLGNITQMGNPGIFKIDKSLCSVREDKDEDKVKEVLESRLMGYQFSILIMPSCLYYRFRETIGGQPSKIFIDADVIRGAGLPSPIKVYKVNKDLIQKIAYVASGFNVNDVSVLYRWDSMKDVNTSFEEILSESRKWLKNSYPWWDVESVGEKESEYHKEMKAVAIRYLIQQRGVKPENIHVETRIEGVVPDIYVSDSNIVIDAKTSIEKEPGDEIIDAYNKYKRIKYENITNEVTEVWVVLRPLPLLLDIDKVVGLYNLFEKLKIMIPAKCGKDYKLLPLEEFLDKMINLQQC